jgi:hypothetical protein
VEKGRREEGRKDIKANPIELLLLQVPAITGTSPLPSPLRRVFPLTVDPGARGGGGWGGGCILGIRHTQVYNTYAGQIPVPYSQ